MSDSTINSNKYCINGRFCAQRITGVERYAYEIVSELDTMVPPDYFTLLIPKDAKNIPSLKNIKVVKKGRRAGIFWEQVLFPAYCINKNRTPICFCGVSPFILRGISYIHDIKYIRKPEFFSIGARFWYKLMLGHTARRSKLLCTVSEFSKKELLDYYNLNSEKISVIPSAWQHMSRVGEEESILKQLKIEPYKYYYALSSIEPNKNIRWIVETAKLNKNEEFVISGTSNKKIFGKQIFGELPSNLIMTGYVTDREAKSLMHYSKGFIFPSWYEGFGLPPLEALAVGANSIIISDTIVMHEVYKNCGVYINPEIPAADLSELCKKVNIEKKKDLLLDNYSWKKSAEKLLKIINKEVCT